ncbi:hypothetical protein [Pseudanabaena sp. FACHB-2040]|uniref:hypothetical protein n=1 Tax=Pseudanabaena sp. FACHB-2040 TaxID=2692859 RepID=UPI001681C980|nr:hypothetical protein [Pseudanabaena sp. FACHB-2040]MBD2258812.1 hypothetical protein [Pseudanabaena sp. FACHB-2040]
MNTTSHLILNLAILRRPTQPQVTWPVLVGAFLPDAAMFVFYGWARFWAGLPNSTIWSEAFFAPFWQDIFAVGNSVPLAGLGLGIAYLRRQPLWMAGFASMLLHHLFDLPLHNDDAHRHFFPLSDFRFISPVSYWDPNHYGVLAALVELVAVLLASVYLLRLIKSRWGRAALLLTNGLTMIFYLGFYVRPLWAA